VKSTSSILNILVFVAVMPLLWIHGTENEDADPARSGSEPSKYVIVFFLKRGAKALLHFN
jgi:hypothetical protein